MLVSWLKLDIPEGKEYNLIEYFAGVGRLAQMAEGVGYTAAGYDYEYGPQKNPRKQRRSKPGKRKPMDLNSDAGLLHLDSMHATQLFLRAQVGIIL